jgi:hypothetical protein
MTAFDLQVAQAISRARLLERMLHDKGPWSAIVFGHETEYRVPADRTVLADEGRVILVAYVSKPAQLRAIEIYCGGDLVTARPVAGQGPCRILVEAGIAAAEAIL